MSKLYSPISIGAIALKHRVAQAPINRLLADEPGGIPGDRMAEYYGERASDGGLQIAEATSVSVTGRGFPGAPGIYSLAQLAGWRKTTRAVHTKGGRIFLQLFHAGRLSHLDLTGGAAPVAPSVVPLQQLVLTNDGWAQVSPHRALMTEEIPDIINEFRSASERARSAGFDGVEIHGGDGYLLDQFLRDGSNRRGDNYGGSIENRARLLHDVVEAVASVWGGDRVGVRLGPTANSRTVTDSDPAATFGYVSAQMNRFGLAYLHVPDSSTGEAASDKPCLSMPHLRELFRGPLLIAGEFEREGAEGKVDDDVADLVAFAHQFATNPDLPARLAMQLPLKPADAETAWGTEGLRASE